HAQYQGASRQAWSVDHDDFAGGANPLEQIEERADLSAWAGQDTLFRAHRHHGEGADKNCGEYRSGEGRPHSASSIDKEISQSIGRDDISSVVHSAVHAQR